MLAAWPLFERWLVTPSYSYMYILKTSFTPRSLYYIQRRTKAYYDRGSTLALRGKHVWLAELLEGTDNTTQKDILVNSTRYIALLLERSSFFLSHTRYVSMVYRTSAEGFCSPDYQNVFILSPNSVLGWRYKGPQATRKPQKVSGVTLDRESPRPQSARNFARRSEISRGVKFFPGGQKFPRRPKISLAVGIRFLGLD